MKIIKTIKYAQLDTGQLIPIIQSYIDFLQINPFQENNENLMAIGYFKQIIEGIEIELLLYDKLTEKGFGRTDRDVIQHLQGLKPIPNGSIEEQQSFIKDVYNTYYDLNHKVRNNLFFMDSIPEVREYLEKNKGIGYENNY